MIDDALARKLTLAAIGEHASFAAAREAGLYVIPQRDRVVEVCLPMVPGTVRKIIRLPEQSRISYDDLYQAASFGLIEAVDSYDPRKLVLVKKQMRPIKISTHAWWRIRKRVLEEVQDTHWVIARPPRAATESFMKDEMNEAERQHYNATVLAAVDFESAIQTGHRDVQGKMAHTHAHALSGDRR